jgi:hypothetical protein
MTLVSLANLYYVYAQFFAPPRYRIAWLYRPDLFVHLMSLLNVVLLLCALFWAPRLLARGVGPPVAETMPDQEAADRVPAPDRDAAVATRTAGRSA